MGTDASDASLSSAAMTSGSMLPLSLTPSPAVPTISVASKAANYTKWSTFFLAACGKFSVTHHIDGSTDPNPDDVTWA